MFGLDFLLSLIRVVRRISISLVVGRFVLFRVIRRFHIILMTLTQIVNGHGMQHSHHDQRARVLYLLHQDAGKNKNGKSVIASKMKVISH